VLEIRPPDDPELDPDRWLNPLQAGDLLHRVFEATLREAKGRMIPAADEAFEALAMDALARGIERMRADVPVPGEGALLRQTSSLRGDVRSFVRMVRRRGAPWVALELRFGLGGEEPALVEVPGGELRLRGAIDRIDEDLHGLTVIDYKTGVPRDFFVAESRLNAPVMKGEFHFPTMRGQNDVMQFGRLELESVRELLGTLLDGVAAGAFIPTDDAGDCRYCDFEYRNAAVWPAFSQLKRARTFER
jgi:hypothetical protein